MSVRNIVEPGGHSADRLACTEQCGYIHYDNPVPVVAAAVQIGDRVVLVRSKTWPAGFFGLVAGFLEKTDASPEIGMRRELAEEIGVRDADVMRMELLGATGHPRMNQVLIVFHVVVRPGTQIVMNEDELAEMKLVSVGELRNEPVASRKSPFFPLLQKIGLVPKL